MEISYSKHLETRLKFRNIEVELPKRIYEEAEERFLDRETGNQVAVKLAYLYGKERDVMVAYRIEGEFAIILTVHPLKEGQKDNRIVSGRWVEI